MKEQCGLMPRRLLENGFISTDTQRNFNRRKERIVEKIEYLLVNGAIVEKDALRVAEAVAEYDPNLYIICNQRPDGPSDPPFILVEKCRDGHMRPVLTAWKLDDQILERIKLADSYKSNPLKTVEQMEAEIKQESAYRYEQFRGEAKDKVEHIVGIRSHYTVLDEQTGELIHFYDDRPSKRTPRPTKRTNAGNRSSS